MLQPQPSCSHRYTRNGRASGAGIGDYFSQRCGEHLGQQMPHVFVQRIAGLPVGSMGNPGSVTRFYSVADRGRKLDAFLVIANIDNLLAKPEWPADVVLKVLLMERRNQLAALVVDAHLARHVGSLGQQKRSASRAFA